MLSLSVTLKLPFEISLKLSPLWNSQAHSHHLTWNSPSLNPWPALPTISPETRAQALISQAHSLKLSPLCLPRPANPPSHLKLKLKLSDPRRPKPPISLNSGLSTPTEARPTNRPSCQSPQTNAVPATHLSQITSDPRRPSQSTSGQLSLSFCSEFFHLFFFWWIGDFFHLGVRCFGLIFLGFCHHAMLWCYFVVKNGVLSAKLKKLLYTLGVMWKI